MEPRQSSGGCLKGAGCLIVIIGLGGALACGGFVFGLFTLITGAIKSSEPYKHGVAQAQSLPAVQQALGEPIEPGWLITGSINISGNDGECDIVVPLSGPEGSGQLYVKADKRAGKWSYDVLEVHLDSTDETIPLAD